MSDIGAMVAELIQAGCSPGVAAKVVAMAFVAGTQAARPIEKPRSAGAIRQERYRDRRNESVTNRNESVTERNAHEPSQSVTDRNESVTSDATPKVPLSIFKNSKIRERQNRGARIDPGWSPSDAEKSFARQEGYAELEVQREINKFRDYWTACAGAKGVKLDWSATWRQWVRNGAERAGKTPAAVAGEQVSSGFYAKAGSEQLAAWDAARMREMGKPYPRDKNQGWHFKTEWPPLAQTFKEAAE